MLFTLACHKNLHFLAPSRLEDVGGGSFSELHQLLGVGLLGKDPRSHGWEAHGPKCIRDSELRSAEALNVCVVTQPIK